MQPVSIYLLQINTTWNFNSNKMPMSKHYKVQIRNKKKETWKMTWTKTVSISKLQKATNWLSAKCRIIYTFYSIVFGKRQDDHHILTTFFSFLLVSFLNNCSLSIVRVQHVFDDGCIASVFFFFSSFFVSRTGKIKQHGKRRISSKPVRSNHHT